MVSEIQAIIIDASDDSEKKIIKKIEEEIEGKIKKETEEEIGCLSCEN